jgi:hypothetical protein
MATNWIGLRPLHGSQEKAFEELCCQLAAGEAYPEGSRFTRKGTPDAGVECYWTLPNGSEHAWQAKFFIQSPTAGQWKQIDDSVGKALRAHQQLTKYTICLPVDRSDARSGGRTSFMEKWESHVAKWRGWGKSRKLNVQFEYWGDSDLTGRLDREENRGRYWFWFSSEQLTIEWFRRNLASAISNAGERYTPELAIELPIARYFSALGRTPEFYQRLNRLYVKLREVSDRFYGHGLPQNLKDRIAASK